jgi:microcystin-dependent protein
VVESTTKNYGWTKPEVTKSASTWGGYLNDGLDSIDAHVFANQNAGVPIGAGGMWFAPTPPPNWLVLDGTSYPTTAPYDKLYAVLSNRFGAVDASHFTLPNLTQKFPLGAGPNPLASAGGAFAVALALANLPAHNHPASQDAHTHAAWQNGHNHTIVTGNHAHGITTGSHGHNIATGGHSHGGVVTGLQGGLPGGPIAGGAGGNLIQGNTAAVGNLGGNTDTAGNLGGNTDTAGNLGGYTDTQTPAVATDSRQPNVYTGNTGSGTAFNVVPPFIAIYFIIRYA